MKINFHWEGMDIFWSNTVALCYRNWHNLVCFNWPLGFYADDIPNCPYPLLALPSPTYLTFFSGKCFLSLGQQAGMKRVEVGVDLYFIYGNPIIQRKKPLVRGIWYQEAWCTHLSLQNKPGGNGRREREKLIYNVCAC